MIKQLYFIYLLLLICSCKSTKQKKVVTKKPNKVIISTNALPKAAKIIKHAKYYLNTPYKYGGSTKKGMDCSGLTQTAFKKEAVNLPRTAKAQSKTGNWIDLKKVKPGDLLFFATKKGSRTITHVGIVTKTRNNHVEFIHASSSKGVIVSSLAERYWYFAFVQARRVLSA